MERFDALIEGYLAYKEDVNKLAPGTLRDIRCSLRRVIKQVQTLRPATALWKLSLEDYTRYVELERQCGASPRCINKYITHVRGLLEYAWRSGRSDRNVLDGFHLQDGEKRTPPRSLSLEEAQALIEACPRATVEQRRDRVMILLLYGCGLRTHELCALNVQHVSVERRELNVLTAKGDKPRTVPIPEAVFTELLAYLHERGGKRGPLFKTYIKKTRVRQQNVGHAVRQAARRAGLSREITAKTLRHSFATHLMDRGVDLGIIASLMGHRSPQETGVYLHVLPSRKERAVTLLAPGA
ncbi:MAG: tyrosine-type recombinase/integrase [Betaproteobacteria bacterium]|nr:tyrosine-type recombinase/integrase [Betaproteobacteria bacterium]